MYIKEEIKKDFDDAVSKIDFTRYNPMSNEFMSAVMIGLMFILLEDEMKIETEKKDDIAEELAGAKKYLQKYLETKDMTYRDMALDEMKHANFLIKKSYAKLPSVEEKEKLKDYERQYKEIAEQIK